VRYQCHRKKCDTAIKCGKIWSSTSLKDCYGMDRDLIRRRLDKVAENERCAILQQVAGVDTAYCQGENNSSRWIMERAHAIAIGMRRAGARMAEEIRSVAIEDASALAEETGKWLTV
jgi:hypothetical protein